MLAVKQSLKVKICGITSVEDAVMAANSGADAIGMVFFERSPRHISDFGLAKEIAQSVGPFVSVVALVVDKPETEIDALLARVPINCLQFHGDESADYCERFHHPFIKALRMKPGLDIAKSIKNYESARGILLDTYVKGVPGGTGETFNWERVPSGQRNIILAGGLNPQNIAHAVATTSPYAVDVSGGVESTPGKKDRTKTASFIRSAKSRY